MTFRKAKGKEFRKERSFAAKGNDYTMYMTSSVSCLHDVLGGALTTIDVEPSSETYRGLWYATLHCCNDWTR